MYVNKKNLASLMIIRTIRQIGACGEAYILAGIKIQTID